MAGINEIDTEMGQQDAATDPQVGGRKAELSSDPIAGNDRAVEGWRSPQAGGGFLDPSLREETADARAADRRAVDRDRRDDDHADTVASREPLKFVGVAGTLGAEAESRADNHGARVPRFDERPDERLGGEIANSRERHAFDAIDEATQPRFAHRPGQEERSLQLFPTGGSGRHAECVRHSVRVEQIGEPPDLGEDCLVAEVNAVKRPDRDHVSSCHGCHGGSARWYHTGRLVGRDRVGAVSGGRYNESAMRNERIAGLELEDDAGLMTLRPRSLDEFIGQPEVKEKLRIYIEAAKRRDEPLDHVLLQGPPGLGKTTLAQIIAIEMGVNVRISSGPAIEKAGDLAAILTNLQSRDVFFIDEIHRLRRNVEEILYPAMEDCKIDIILGEGPSAQSLRIDLPRFTLVGATTRAGLISAPMRDRFEVMFRLGFYGLDELQSIIVRAGRLLGIDVDEDGARELAKRARGTPRIANRLLRRTRDFAEVRGDGRIDLETARLSLEMLQIDQAGLDELDRAVLDVVVRKFGGGPVGLDTLAAALSEEKDTITDIVEPYLLQEGFLQRTPQGRVATERAFAHLGATRNDRLF